MKFINTTLTGVINDASSTNVCSFLRCMICQHKGCETSQQARNHGKKAYDVVIRELETARFLDFLKIA